MIDLKKKKIPKNVTNTKYGDVSITISGSVLSPKRSNKNK